MHTEGLDAVVAQYFLLSPIHVPQTNVYELLQTDLLILFQPPKHVLPLLLCQPSQESHGHAVNVAAVACLWRVDVGVCVHPDDRHLSTESLSDSFSSPGHRANCYRMISSEGEDASALLCVLIDLLTQLLSDSADSKRLLHVSIIGVGLWHDRVIRMNSVIVEQIVAEVFFKLCEKAGRYEG